MVRRAALMASVILGTSLFASAQSLPLAPAEAELQCKSSNDAGVVLEMQWLALNDNILERAKTCSGIPQWKNLPNVGGWTACNKAAAQWLVNVASGDRRSSVSPAWTIAVLDGDRRQLRPFGPPGAAQETRVIRANVTEDRQAFQIHLARIDEPDNSATAPGITATVPVGSHLLIHTHDALSTRIVTQTSYWDRLFNTKPRTIGIGRERLQVFLLVAPRVGVSE